MKCKHCSVELDVKLDYCASCVGKGFDVKEFDLRPFEVKKPKYEIVGAINSTMTPYWYANDEDELRVNIGLIFNVCNIKEVMFKRLNKEWTFEDIQVGWFFKCADGDLYWKHEESEFRSLGSRCHREKNQIDFAHFFVLGTNLDLYSDLKEYGKITNAYDCQELAKALMIERIIT